MTDEVAAAVFARWAAWIDEFEMHPLDDLEFLGMLECRDSVAAWLEISGDAQAAARVDGDDARFRVLTMGRNHDRFPVPQGAGWWWVRVPAGPEAYARFLGDY